MGDELSEGEKAPGGNEHVSERFLKSGRIENPGLVKPEAISGAMGFPPALWFVGAEEDSRTPDDTLLATLKDGTIRSILEEPPRLRPKDRRLLLGIACQISPPPEGG